MAVRIRLTRVGATKRPAYRVIAIDKRRSRDGRALEILGYYDPLTEPATVKLDTEKINAWIGKGAQPSETVVKLMAQAERAAAAGDAVEKPKRPSRSAAKSSSKKAPARAATAATEPSEDVAASTEAAAEGETPAEPAAEVPAEEGATTDETEKAEA